MQKEKLVPAEKRSIFQLLSGIVTRPRNTLTHLKDNQLKSWWLPALIVILMAVVFNIANTMIPTVMPGMNMGEYGNEMVIEGERMEGGYPLDSSASPGMMPAGQSGVAGFMVLLGTLGTVVSTPIGWLIWAGALYLTSVFLGRSSGFRQMFRLTVWAQIPYAIRSLIQSIFVMLSGSPINNAGLSGFANNPAANPMLPPKAGQLALASILGHVDIYLVWNLLLIATGLIVFTNLPRKKAIIATLAIWIVLVLIGALPAIIGGTIVGMS